MLASKATRKSNHACNPTRSLWFTSEETPLDSLRLSTLGKSYHTGTDSGSRVARSQRVFVSSSAAVIFAGIHDQGSSNNGMGPHQLDHGIRNLDVTSRFGALRGSFRDLTQHVAQITHHALIGIRDIRSPVRLAKGIENGPTGCRSAVRHVPVRACVNPVLARSQAVQFAFDNGGRIFRGLREMQDAHNGGTLVGRGTGRRFVVDNADTLGHGSSCCSS